MGETARSRSNTQRNVTQMHECSERVDIAPVRKRVGVPVRAHRIGAPMVINGESTVPVIGYRAHPEKMSRITVLHDDL